MDQPSDYVRTVVLQDCTVYAFILHCLKRQVSKKRLSKTANYSCILDLKLNTTAPYNIVPISYFMQHPWTRLKTRPEPPAFASFASVMSVAQVCRIKNCLFRLLKYENGLPTPDRFIVIGPLNRIKERFLQALCATFPGDKL